MASPLPARMSLAGDSISTRRLSRNSLTPMERLDESSDEELLPRARSSHRWNGHLRPTFARCSAHKMPPGTESISYAVNESRQYLEYLKRSQHAGLSSKDVLRWSLNVGIGAFTGLVAVAVEYCIEVLCHWRMETNDEVVGAVRDMPGGVVVQYLCFVGMRLAMASVAGFLVCYVEVLAAGSGIPEIKCYLNGVRLRNVVGLKALVAKAAGIVFSVAADLPVGKEGPMIHSGAIIGSLATNINLRRFLGPFNIDIEERDLVAAGACAGVSAAFGAPMGSVLFAIEEGTSHMSPFIMMRLFVTSCIAALVSCLFVCLEEGHPLSRMGSSIPVSFGKFLEQDDYDLRDMFFFTFVALAGGASGSAFNAMNKQLSLWRQRHIPSTGGKRFLEVLAVDLLIVTILFWIPVLATGGKPLEYTDLDVDPTLKLYWDSGTGAMKQLFHYQGSFHSGYLLLFALLNFGLSCLTYGLGVPSGLFVPSLLTGAAYGRLVGQWVHYLFGERDGTEAGMYALIGAVSNLAGAARITVSLAMILIEATGNATYSLPIFYAVMVAKWTGDALSCVTDKGIYDMHIIELKHTPFLEHSPKKHMVYVQVREVMARSVKCFEVVETVGNVLDTLESCGHRGFPVLYPGAQRLAGSLRRSVVHHLLELALEHDILQEPTGELLDMPVIPYEEFAFSPSKLAPLEELRAELEPKLRLDLRPYVDRNGYTMPKHASVASCFSLFRTLGLRHLPIVAPNGDLCGIVTRKDLILCEKDRLAQKDSEFDANGDDESYSESDSFTTQI